jgi:hypothetical protein
LYLTLAVKRRVIQIKTNVIIAMFRVRNALSVKRAALLANGKRTMNFSIQGKLTKINEKWSVEIPVIDYGIQCERPLLCLQELERKLKDELEDENLKCFYRIDDNGVFYLITAHTPEFIEFISTRLVDLEAIKLEPGLDDD